MGLEIKNLHINIDGKSIYPSSIDEHFSNGVLTGRTIHYKDSKIIRQSMWESGGPPFEDVTVIFNRSKYIPIYGEIMK